ncbi:MAG TPA: cyclic pyranopterin monophosphate synthase MoaC [Sphingobium sp.]|uniref:cyclic pyranopterin monophosphate synthase MoaC n=1 Tax=Sphingobium sp. TaxID=1912891 RepID=UPI002ED2CF69
MTGGLSHVTGSGDAHMVDVSAKQITVRSATARGRISVNAAALAAIAEGTVAKGDVLATARIAGIMAAKRTAELIPLCHPLPLSGVTIEIMADDDGIEVVGTARTAAQTGVEMEAITAVSVALLTLYDMLKALDKMMVIGSIRVTEKRGGKSGDWTAP